MPGKVRNMVTIGGPHMGVDKVPHCFEGAICDAVNLVIKRLVYLAIAQDWIAPAGYFRDVLNYEGYVKGSVFLPALNNEVSKSAKADPVRDDAAKNRKDRFSALNGAMLVMFTEDTMIYPKETAHFRSMDPKEQKVL